VVKLISVEETKDGFSLLFVLLAVFSAFICLLSAFISSKREIRPKTSF
jgi:hypothetical protein